MGVGVKASDWGAASIASVSGAADGMAAGVWIYAFSSLSAKETFVGLFSGMGAGVGSGAGSSKAAVEAVKAILQRVRVKASMLDGLPFSKLTCVTPFCVQDFDFCLGRISTARVSAGPLAFGPTFISAAPITLGNALKAEFAGGLLWNPCYFNSAGSIPGTASIQPLNPSELGAPQAQASVTLGIWGRLSLD